MQKVSEENLPVERNVFELDAIAAGIGIAEGGESWGVSKDLEGQEKVFANDLLIPKLWLMQGSSDWVKSREHEHRAGDWANSLTGEILGGPENDINFVVISMQKNWQFFWLDMDGDKIKKVFDGKESGQVTLENMNAAYEGEVEGRKFRRRQVLRFTILLERDIEQGNRQPYIVDFAATSKKGGRILYNDIQAFCSKPHEVMGKKYKLPSAAAAYALSTTENTEYEEGSVWVKNVRPLGFSSREAVEISRELYELIDGNDAVEYHEVYEEAEVVNTESQKVVDNVENGTDIV